MFSFAVLPQNPCEMRKLNDRLEYSTHYYIHSTWFKSPLINHGWLLKEDLICNLLCHTFILSFFRGKSYYEKPSNLIFNIKYSVQLEK